MKKLVVLTIFLVAVVSVAMTVKTVMRNDYEAKKNPFDPQSTQEVSVMIPDGATAKTVAKILKDKGIIGDEVFFVKYIKETGIAKELKAGSFRLSPRMNADEILKALTEIPKSIEKFVIPEGFELRSIAGRMEEKGIGTAEDFMKLTSDRTAFSEEFSFLKKLPEGATLEGYLFPATFEINEDTTQESLLREMLKAYQARYNKSIEPNLKDRDLNMIMTLASIVEKEAKTDADRPLIASVCYNRIKKGMPLQMDSTVQYAKGERKSALNYEDLKIDSPYNTYKNKGLPPGPIASPGLPSIEAALNPPETKYLFFVLTGKDGSHTFTETYEEHLKAKEKMIRP